MLNHNFKLIRLLRYSSSIFLEELRKTQAALDTKADFRA